MDLARIRADFPILGRKVRGGRPLVYLDSAATSQKPVAVLEALARYYREANANVHRAVHELAEQATEAFEQARQAVARFIAAPDPRCVIFVRNTTEAINLVARAWVLPRLRPGDEVLVTLMEHHSNLVPWHMVARQSGARVRFVELLPDGTLDMASFERLLTERTRVLAVTHQSNVLGTVNPVAEMARRAREAGAVVLVDGAQSVPHMPVDVTALGCDFLAFSAHKMLGPTGVGVLWGRRELLEAMEPLFGGGEMIREVTLEGATWNDLPHRFEAGTPPIAEAVGLGAAVAYLESVGMAAVHRHEQELARYALERLGELPDVEIYGPREGRGGLVAFNLRGVHPHDVATVLDQLGIAVRAGHHCAQPLARWLGVPATVRASFYLYTLPEEIDALVTALEAVRSLFRPSR